MTRTDHTKQRPTGVLVLVSDPDDRAVLETWVESHGPFRRVEREGSITSGGFDICVLDGAALWRHHEALRQVRADRAPLAVPTLLVTPAGGPEAIEWPSGSLGRVLETTVEQIITSPIEGSELDWRLGALRERRALTEWAAERHLHYQQLFDGAQDPIVVADPDRRIVTCNAAFTDSFGYSCSEIEGESTRILCAGESDYRAMGRHIERHGSDQFRTTITFETKSGERLTGETDVIPLENGNGESHGFIGVIRDVSDRHRQASQLSRYEYAVEGATDMLVGIDTDRRIRFANERFRTFLGLTDEHLENASLHAVLDEQTLRTVEPDIERALHGECVQDEIVERDAESRERVLDVRYYPLEREDGSIIGAAAAIRDVTERERHKDRLARFRRAVEAAGHAIYITDADGTIEYVNPAFEAMTEYSAAEARGATPRILRSGEMPDGYYDDLWATVLSGDVWEERVVNRRQSGELYHADQTIAPITNGDGAVEAFVAIQTDVTERVETKADLETYEAIVQRLEDPIMLQDREGQFVVLNDAVAEYAGLGREELLGRDEFAFMDERTAASIDRKKQRVLDEQRAITYEVEPSLPNGSTPTFKTTRYPHYDGDGQLVGTIAICRDMTDVQERDRQLQVLDRLLRHNLRNKMTVIFGEADRIIDDPTADAEPAAQRILKAGADIVSLSETEREMIDVFESRQARRPIAIRPILERLQNDLTAAESEASITIECPTGVRAETIPHVERAIGEVLENAIEHAEDLAPEIVVSVTREAGVVRIAVADDGPGMPETERAVLTGDAEITPLVHGSGLGLWLVHHVVTQSAGSLDFHENDPCGSVVEIRLPSAATPEHE